MYEISLEVRGYIKLKSVWKKGMYNRILINIEKEILEEIIF